MWGTTLEPFAEGKTAGWGGSKNSLGSWETDQGKGRRASGLRQEAQGYVANYISLQASVRAHGWSQAMGRAEDQDFWVAGSKPGRKNKMKKESRKPSPAPGNRSTNGHQRVWDLALFM